ncbi:MAG: DMT family transporter [Parvibaculum sp.]
MNQQGHTMADYRDLALLTFLWGGSFALTDIAISTMSPAWSVAIRMLIAATVLAPFMIINREHLPRTSRMWVWLIALALCGDLIPFFLLSSGIELVTSGLAAVLIGVMPLFTLALARIFVPGESFTVLRVVGFALGLTGLVIIVGPDALTPNTTAQMPLLGEALVLGGAFFFAVNAIIARRAPPAPLYTKACLTTGLAGLIMLPFAWAETPLNIEAVSLNSWLAVIALGALPVGFATVIYFRIIENAGPAFMAITNYLVPIVALVIGVLFLDEQVTLATLLGFSVILAGIALSELRR